MSFSFTGNHFAIIGASKAAVIEVYVDGELYETKETTTAQARQCTYSADVSSGEHTVIIKVISGNYTIDAIEY